MSEQVTKNSNICRLSGRTILELQLITVKRDSKRPSLHNNHLLGVPRPFLSTHLTIHTVLICGQLSEGYTLAETMKSTKRLHYIGHWNSSSYLLCVNFSRKIRIGLKPLDKPAKHFTDKSEVWLPKILQWNEPRISQGPHHFSQTSQITIRHFWSLSEYLLYFLFLVFLGKQNEWWL